MAKKKKNGVKIVYVTYITPRRLNQKQFAFISGLDENISINGAATGLITDKNVNDPMIEVITFSSEKRALEDAAKYCGPGYIYVSKGKNWVLA